MRSLDEIIAELSAKDRMQRVIWTVHEQIPEFFSVQEPMRVVEEVLPDVVVQQEAFAPMLYHTSSVAAQITYSSSATVQLANYSKPDSFYVHVPSWVKVHRAPFHEFGSSLFGLAYTSTGDVHIREDLQGMHFTEVLAHEVLHQLYPSCSESQIRQMVLARFGSSAEIHTHVTKPF